MKDWTIDEHEACHSAIENSWLMVQLVPGQDSARQATPPQSIPEKLMAPSKIPDGDEFTGANSNATSSMQESSSATPPLIPIESDQEEELTFDEKLTELLAEPLAQVKNVVGSALKSHVKRELSMRDELRNETEQTAQLKTKIEALEQKIRQFQQEKVEDRDRIAQARAEGRREGQEHALRLMKEIDDVRKQSEMDTHLMQVERAREEGFREGVRQANEKGSNEKREEAGSDATVKAVSDS